MEMETIVTIVLGVYGVASNVVALIKSKSKSKTTGKLTQVEQENDLRDYMIEEIENAESTAKLFKQEDDLSTWKKNTVLKNVTLYAKGQNYSWFDKDIWSEKIDNYVKGTKKVNFIMSSVN